MLALPLAFLVFHDIALLNSLGVRLVLIHGSRPQIAQRLEQAGQETAFHDGVRITDMAALEHVKDAAGSLRAQIEALLSMGLPNSPMQGSRIRVCSGNFVTAKPLGVVEGVDYQHTGKVRRVDVTGIRRQLEEGSIVLVSPLGYSPTGEIFSLTLEDIAVHCASAIGADKLIMFSQGEGITDATGELVRQCRNLVSIDLGVISFCFIKFSNSKFISISLDITYYFFFLFIILFVYSAPAELLT